MSAATEAVEVPRDRWQRPLIIPLDDTEPVAYTRVSTLAKALDDTSNLMTWKARKAIEGVVRRPDLLTRAAGALATGDPDTDWPTKKALNAVVSEATEAAGSGKGASAGTGLHSLTEAIDRGMEPLWVPEADKPRLDAYRAATARYEAVDVETFIVNDEVRAAGTFDRLYRCPDGRVRVADLKTGKSEADYPTATTIQIAIYAQGRRYDPATGERSPLAADLDLTTGLLIHLPPSGGCTVYELNLTVGWPLAQLAARVRDARALKADELRRAVAS